MAIFRWSGTCLCLSMLSLSRGTSSSSSAAAAAQPHSSCDVSQDPVQVCDDFCNYRCGFFNSSDGEDGSIKNVTLYRMTPRNVTGIRNKDTGDANGDVTFFLTKKNLTQLCANNPQMFGCFLDGDNLYGKFVVEMSTSFGPYFECNPMNHGKNPLHPDWVDTSDFYCAQGCLLPTTDGCRNMNDPKTKVPQVNGTTWGPYECWCDTTRRHEKTVGRSLNPISAVVDRRLGPNWWPPQCSLSYKQAGDKKQHTTQQCAKGTVLREVKGWSFASTAAAACDACDTEEECTGWATYDNSTAVLFKGEVLPSDEKCIGGAKQRNARPAWIGAGNVGGYWYSTSITAECPAGKPIGFNGCSWRVVEAAYKNASCIDHLVDVVVENHGQRCFKTCQQPLNRTSDCYLNCYRNTLLGDASYNITPMKDSEIVSPWEIGFQGQGECPDVVPEPCIGSQCPDPLLSSSSAADAAAVRQQEDWSIVV